ncbi:MAG: hypothetical protein ACO3RV_06995 [Luteolibacter sp.]
MNPKMQTMMNMTPKQRCRVQLGAPVNRTFHPSYAIDAHALLWASAKGREFIPAHATIEGEQFQNGPLRKEPLPDAHKFPVLRERIGYWETVIEIDDPQILLESAVMAALNSFHELMGENPLAEDPETFVTTITQAAREWAEDCFTAEQP